MNATCLSPLHKIVLLLVAALTLTACASDDIAIDSAPTPSAAYVEGEVLVGLKSGVIAQRAAVRGELLPGSKELERIVIGGSPAGVHAVRASVETETAPPLEVLRLQLPVGMAVEEAVAQLSGRSEVLYAEPNYKVRRAAVPIDTFFYKQWGLRNAGGITFDRDAISSKGSFTGPGPDIGATAAWDVSSGDGSVIVATIDTGIEYDHPDLKDAVWLNPGESGGGKESNGLDDDKNGYVDDWHGWNYVEKINDINAPKEANDPIDTDTFGIGPTPTATLGHGSHVAGIIGAVGNNNVGISGINWNVKLMPLKFLSSTGEGDVANAVKAINYAVAKGAKIINASYEYSSRPDWVQTESAAIAAAGAAGVIFVAAAGNSGVNIDNALIKVYPAAHPLDNIIAVAATDPNDGKASFSNYGVTSVDLGAPGVYIYSTVRTDRIGVDGEAGYDYMSGTSMAAPMVSGAAALVWSKHPTLTATEVRQILLSTVDKTLPNQVASGGRLNLAKAMAVNIALPAPAAPTGLSGIAEGNGARLAWIDNASDEESFIVERSLPGEAFAEVAHLAANSTTYFDGTVRDGVVASYRVKALAGISPSAYSNEVEVTLPLRPPADLTAYADTLGIHLNWADASSAETGFKVERRAEGASAFSEIATLPALSTGFTDKDVVAGGRYYYRVRTYSTTLGDSAYTNEILAQMAGGGGSGSKDSKCFIATAAFGTPLAPQVKTLRAFRDRVLLTNPPGRLFVALYYRTSPPLADFIAGHDSLRTGVRTLLYPLVWLAKMVTPSEAQAMGLRREPPAAVNEEGDVVAGELLVCFRPEVSAEAIAAILSSEQSERLEEIPSPQGTLLRIKLASGVTTSAAQKRFSAYQEVVYAEPNRRVSIRKP